MAEQQRILVVDDEPQIVRVLKRSLMTSGYDVRAASNGSEALQVFNNWRPDLVVTDLSMPSTSGLELCKLLRAISRVPIIVLSVKGEEKTKVEALDAGADDYITKPFGIDELLARIRATLRRMSTPPPESEPQSVINLGDFRIDHEARNVTVKGQEVHLTPKEYDLLVFLTRHPGKVLTHRMLLSAVWGGNYVEQNEYLRVFVGQLRKKIELDPSQPKYILTEPWIGYRFDPGQ